MISSRAAGSPGCHAAPGRARALRWLVGGALVLAPCTAATAQLTVDQLSIVFRLTPGEPRLGVLTLRNDSDQPLQAMIGLHDWDRNLDGTNQWHALGTVPGSCGDALEVFPPTVNLPPGGTQAIRITIDSTFRPERECWAAAMIETAAPPPSSGMSVVHRMRTATKIYVQPPGVAPIGAVEGLRVGAMSIQGDSVRAVEVVVANTGGQHFEGQVELQIRTPDNQVVEALPLPTAYVLGGARVRVRAAFPDLPPGRYLLLAVVDYGGAELAAGQIEYRVP
ncbi:MAG: molecular chaperone [Gemmatimonadales bacterium]